MTKALLPRIEPERIASSAVLGPLVAADEYAYAPFWREGDAFYCELFAGKSAHTATWPDGSVGHLVFWPDEDRDARLRAVYVIAREQLESELLGQFNLPSNVTIN